MNKQTVVEHNDSILNTYLQEISKLPIYSTKEIIEFIKLAQNGDKIARDKVINSNLRFVVTMAKKWQGRGVPLMDLISEGTLGLMHSIDLFDADRGVPFINYAAHWIKQYIYQSIYWTGREIRLPVSQQVKVITLLKAEAEFSKKFARRPSSAELCELTGISEKDINYLSQFGNKLVSIDDFIGGDPENNQVCDIIPDNEPLLDEQINQDFIYKELDKILEVLNIREHDIICMLFGLGRSAVDNKQIADMFGIGTERVRQIKENALQKLRKLYGSQLKTLLK